MSHRSSPEAEQMEKFGAVRLEFFPSTRRQHTAPHRQRSTATDR